ncbi:hypothetical protein PsorP6_007343 [Peronosclerospora sorghi]|uniref:Uncharacterized protein n=1 Tax=Peronosclerospora sorghi TaxID=230839 RepID=A0ACC0WA53_9STRA|nr:hypothetical protein PsorP6_007343 [Peronosclerospora sorghi]
MKGLRPSVRRRHEDDSVIKSPSQGLRFLLASTSRDLEQSLRLEFPSLVASHEPWVDWSAVDELQEGLNQCDGVILAASGCGDDVMTFSSHVRDEWLHCEQNVANLVSKAHRVVKLSWMEGFVAETSPLAVGRATWSVEEALKGKMGHESGKLTILRASMGMDAFLRGRLFELVCGRTLSISVKHGRIAFVHPLDVAETLLALVTKEETGQAAADDSTGRVQVVTGPEALTFPQVAQCLSTGLREQVTYSYFPLWAVQPARWIRGIAGDAIEQEVAVMRALEAGCQQEVHTDVIETLVGHTPRSFRSFVAEHAAAWPRTDPL